MKYLITGGAGFIGSNLVKKLLYDPLAQITVIDNFTTGQREFLPQCDPRLEVIEGDLRDTEKLAKSMTGVDVIFHLASNSDIAKAVIEPTIDFDQGIVLTQIVLEEARKANIKRILFTSGSGVYGEIPPEPILEEYPKMIPISTYGAQKLASEAFISAYAHMFEIRGTVFRFANVVGPNMTHGVSYDFVKKLRKNPNRLEILGDGNQSKPYVYVDDVLDAMIHVVESQQSNFEVFNVGTDDHLLVKDIAEIVINEMGLSGVSFTFTGGQRGWKADVPVYRLDTEKIKSLGWKSKMNSFQSVTEAVRLMVSESSL